MLEIPPLIKFTKITLIMELSMNLSSSCFMNCFICIIWQLTTHFSLKNFPQFDLSLFSSHFADCSFLVFIRPLVPTFSNAGVSSAQPLFLCRFFCYLVTVMLNAKWMLTTSKFLTQSLAQIWILDLQCSNARLITSSECLIRAFRASLVV